MPRRSIPISLLLTLAAVGCASHPGGLDDAGQGDGDTDRDGDNNGDADRDAEVDLEPCETIECPRGAVCERGLCVDVCDTMECPPWHYCDTGRCILNNPCLDHPCPIVGEACYLDDETLAPYCSPPGLSEAGASCLESSDCAPEYVCVHFTGATAGTCQPRCDELVGLDCGGGSRCIMLVDASGTAQASGACSLRCDLITQAGCAEGYACDTASTQLQDQNFADLTHCRAAGGGQIADHCDEVSCTEGLTCILSGDLGGFVCAELCRGGEAPTPCSDGTPCLTPWTVDGEPYGFCIPLP